MTCNVICPTFLHHMTHEDIPRLVPTDNPVLNLFMRKELLKRQVHVPLGTTGKSVVALI